MKHAIGLAILGIWLIIDGLASIYVYRHQTAKEHIIRVLRACGGTFLILIVLEAVAHG